MVCCLQLHLMGPAFDAGPGAGLEDGANGLEGTLVRAIILCVCTASASYEAGTLSFLLDSQEPNIKSLLMFVSFSWNPRRPRKSPC